jgi:hypothetical protein
MIRGYPRYPSVLPGDTLTLHVSTDQPEFRVEFYRVGRGLHRMELPATARFAGHNYPPGPTDQDWGWPGYGFVIPSSWPTGCYIAMLVAVSGDGVEHGPDMTTADGVDSKAFFVVRNPHPGQEANILYKVSWATFHAYNATGYGSLYQEAVWARDHPNPGFKVTTRRPGGGTGGVVMMGDSPDYYDTSSRRQTFAHWDPPFIGWLEEHEYKVDFCTDLDLHQDEALLLPYNLLLSVGHDEYWSPEMRAHIEQFVHAGGNVAYFSGNIDGWQIHFQDDDTAFTCAKVGPSAGSIPTASILSGASQGIDSWEHDSNQARDPENRTTGVSYYMAGGWWDGKRETLGYTVQHAEHWLYDGTGLADDDVFGDDEALPLVGYECDGADFRILDGKAFATGRYGTPPSFFILGVARLSSGWHTFRLDAAATMGIYTSLSGGIVFQGATTDWPMAVPRNRTVATITSNVLDRLCLRSVRVLGPLPGYAGRMLAEESEMATFVVDTSRLPENRTVKFSWHVSGAETVHGDSPSLDVRMPSASKPMTISVTVSDANGPVAFGTCTSVPLAHVDTLRMEIVNLLREMATPGDPSGSFVMATADPVLVSRGIVTVNVPLLRDRAKRLGEVTAELLEIWSRDGTPPMITDPRERWSRSDDNG